MVQRLVLRGGDHLARGGHRNPRRSGSAPAPGAAAADGPPRTRPDGGGLEASLVVIAIGAGSLGLNYVNHAGFWLVKESFGMDLVVSSRPAPG
ncbi:GntT/GntP/DsdX family permease [Streptomyces lydicus]|uniref:GntT/GntP/DsdX family permease n=1 Tax=Streptomyces lydicus TaxID=47763 RepID=UPI000B32F6C2